MNFGIWDDSVQMHPEQVKRFERALTSKLIPISVDVSNKTGVFNGSHSKPYNTTLENCTCSDFIRRQLPCKHIYRLAIELGLIDTDGLTVATGAYGNDDRTLKNHIISYIDTLNETDAHILATYFFDFTKNSNHKLMRISKVPNVVLSCEVFTDTNNIEAKLEKLTVAELKQLIPEAEQKVKKLKKSELISLILSDKTIDLSTVTDTIIDLSVKEIYKPILNSLHRYIHKIYPQNRDYYFLFE